MSILCQFCRDAKKRHFGQACSPRSVHKPDRFCCFLPEWTWIERVKLWISSENTASRKTVVFGGASGGRSRWHSEILRGCDAKVWPIRPFIGRVQLWLSPLATGWISIKAWNTWLLCYTNPSRRSDRTFAVGRPVFSVSMRSGRVCEILSRRAKVSRPQVFFIVSVSKSLPRVLRIVLRYASLAYSENSNPSENLEFASICWRGFWPHGHQGDLKSLAPTKAWH